MPSDSDRITVSKSPEDFNGLIIDGLSGINYKMSFFLLFIFMLLMSDVFTSRVLSQFEGAVDYKSATSYGTFLQGLFLVLGYIILDVIIKQKII